MARDFARRTGSLEENEQKFRVGAIKGVLAWGDLTRQKAQLKAPVKTARLARSIKLGDAEELAPLQITVDIGTNVEYAAAQEFGSGQFAERNPVSFIRITARRRKVLRFKWPGFAGDPRSSAGYDPESGYFFFRSVKHPGVRPRRYLRGALDEEKQHGARLAVQAVMAEFGKR
jgi:hypothetical protein